MSRPSRAGRPDADAELWGLLVQAINAVGAGTATTDQQNADAWLTAVMQREDVLAAQDAGLEYSKWAGLGSSAYQTLLNSNPSESDLESFLSGTPEPYADGDSISTPESTSNEGYCTYEPPAPDQSDYTGNIYTPAAQSIAPETCFETCTALLGCAVPTPTYDQFVEWGEADVNYELFDNSGFASAEAGIAVSATLGAVASVGSVAAGIGTTFALGDTLGLTAFQQTVFPFASRLGPDYVLQSANAAEAEGEGTEEAVEGALDLADDIGGEVAATGVGAIVAAIIFAITTAVQEGLSVFTAAALPGQLATDIANAPSSNPDLGSMLSNSSEAQGLYSLFVGATLPAPTFTSCNNTPTGLVIGGRNTVLAPTAPCLNATPVPAEQTFDPQWVVTPRGSSTSTTQPTITWADASTQLNSTAYLDGNWFVDTATIGGTQATVQTLRLQYTDWDGNENTAWLFDNASPPEFLTIPDSALGANFNPSTCSTSGTCSLTPTIDLVGADGSDYSVSVTPGGAEAPPLPPDPTSPSALCSNDNNALGCVTLNPTMTTVTASPGVPGVGQEVTFTATMPTIFAEGTVDFSSGATDLCSAVPLQETSVEVPGGAFGGEEFEFLEQATCTTTFSSVGAEYVFATYSGDSIGNEPSQGEVTVDVGNQAATTTSVSASTSTPVVGQPVDYTATVAVPGTTGTTPTGTVTFTNGGTTVCAGVALSAGGTAACTQAYQAPGQGTVTATYSGDSATQGSSGQAAVTVGQALSLTRVQPSPPNPVVGQPVTYTALVNVQAPDSEGPAPTGTVTFTNGGTTVCTSVALSPVVPYTASCSETYQAAGTVEVTANYSGDSATESSSGSTTLQVNRAPTSTSVSASPSKPVVGQPVVYTATVALEPPATNGPAPAGTVTFTNGGTTACANVALSPAAPYTATCSVTYRGPGSQMVTAAYSGDSSTLPSHGQAGVSVNRASSSTSVTVSTSQAVVGEPVTFTANVAVAPPDTNGPAPTGTVTFTNGATVVCSRVALSASGSASCSGTFQSPGVRTITAAYSGDTATLSSSGQAGVSISQASSSTSVSASTSTPVVGQPVTYTATVAVAPPDTNGPAPTGTVTFTNGATVVCSRVPLSASGTASCSETFQSPQVQAISATYSGDSNTFTSSGEATATVAEATTSTTLSASPASPSFGQPITYTATVLLDAPATDGPRRPGPSLSPKVRPQFALMWHFPRLLPTRRRVPRAICHRGARR